MKHFKAEKSLHCEYHPSVVALCCENDVKSKKINKNGGSSELILHLGSRRL